MRLLPVRLAQAGAWLWGVAPFCVLALRPSPGNHLPPRDQWGSAEEETAELNNLVAGFTGFLILSFAAAVVCFWVYATICLRRGSRDAPVLVVVTALGSALLAVAGTNRIFHSLLDARPLGILAPLLSVSLATLVVTLRTRPRHLPATAS
ncbi:hypothetical protein [Kitasatospora sp. NPDC001683]